MRKFCKLAHFTHCLYSKNLNKPKAFMPQAHRHHQLLWSSPLLFYWRTLLSQLQAAWAASPCPGLCSSPRKIKKKIKCLWSACRLLHSDLSFSMHQLKPCSPWPHSVSVSNIKLVRMKEKYPAWPSRVAFVQRKSGNCKLNFSCNLEAVFSPILHTENTVTSGKEVTNLSPLFQRREQLAALPRLSATQWLLVSALYL